MRNSLYYHLALIVLVLMSSSCEDNPASTNPPPTSVATDFAFVITTDFLTGSASVIWFDGSYTTDKNVNSVHSDAVARYYNGLIYVLNRFGADNIQVLDPQSGFSTIRQFSVGPGSDPHDIAFVSETKAYVTRYNSTELWIVNPTTGTKQGSVDLSLLADGDGIPEMDHLQLMGDRLFVTVQRVDRNTNWNPVGLSYVAVIDVAADTLIDIDPTTGGVQAIELVGTNPFSDLQLNGTKFYIACAGDWGVADSGVELIDASNLTTEGIVLAGATVTGDITDVAIVSEEKGYAIVTDANFHNLLVSFNPKTGAVTGTVYAPGDFVLPDVALGPGAEIFLGDRTVTNPGVRIYGAGTGVEITNNPIDAGLPPFSIMFGTVETP